MSDKPTSSKWAFKISHILNSVYGENHFPINVSNVAKEISLQLYPEEPIALIKGDSLPGFEGGLFRGDKGWGILYNSDIRSTGRINYTQAHEFGHYLLHREQFPEGLQCGVDDFIRWDSVYGQIEHQANQFAANLLMPLDDYRRQIPPPTKIDLDMIKGMADRYEVSLMAALLRWIDYTEQRAVMVVSRDGFILWARSSKRALKTGAFFRTANVPPVAIPSQSVAANRGVFDEVSAKLGKKFGECAWFREECEELAIFSDQYDFVVSLILLDHYSTTLFSSR